MEVYKGVLADDLEKIDGIAHAEQLTGKLSKTEKMPGYSFNLPASQCKVGSKLRHIPGTTCFKCYAADTIEWVRAKTIANKTWTGSRYAFNNVRIAMSKRFEAINNPLWVPAMVWLIRERCAKKQVFYFRWHDSGDIQSIEHLRNICLICEALPEVKFWLPTREYTIVRDYLKSYVLPDNLCLRLSASFIDGKAPQMLDVQTSTVSTGIYPTHGGKRCHAKSKGNSCGDCRVCWNKDIPNVDYAEH